ncbi:MAG: MlaD family protein [Opitutales bacterium]
MKKANPLAIGIFVITAIFLLFAGIIVLGAGKFFQKTKDYICFFNETVNGLDVGAPVKYKGVTLGKINKIYISSDSSIKAQKVMVVFSLIEGGDVNYSFSEEDSGGLNEKIDLAIKEGLRAKLAYQSIVTGMLYIELDYFAKEGDVFEYSYKGVDLQEMPTMPSNAFDELSKKLTKVADEVSKMPLAEIGTNVNKALITLNAKLEELDTKNISENAVKLLADINDLVEGADIKLSIEKLNKVLDGADTLLLTASGELNTMSKNFGNTLSKGDEFLDNINAMTSRYSPFMTEFSLLLNTLRSTSQSAQSLMEYLERNPSALLKGKPLESSKK